MRRRETARWASTYCFELLPSLLQRQVYAAGPRTVNPCYETAESVLSYRQTGGCARVGGVRGGVAAPAEPVQRAVQRRTDLFQAALGATGAGPTAGPSFPSTASR